MNSTSNEFIAENELVEVVMSRSIDKLKLLQGEYGPFKPLERHFIPLWLALLFEQKHKAKIIQPACLTTEFLTDKLNQERTLPEFSNMPFYFIEQQKLLQNSITQKAEITDLLDDLIQVRSTKIRQGLQTLDGQYLQTNNLSFAEIEKIRRFFTKSFDEIQKL